ncbi:MAG: L-Ala-D/L-Glu epimerase [Rhodospirillales bacterium]|nr:L-Ala-D/L-Glu epimerase [Rhodospirillales bacterium]
MMRKMTMRGESWPLARPFTISRGTKTTAEVVVVEIEENGAHGRGECVPYPRYGESTESVLATIAAAAADIEAGLDRSGLRERLTPGAARNALDCALWDLDAKTSGRHVWQIAAGAAPRPVVTAETIALDTAEAMAAAAQQLRDRPSLKIKVGAEDVVERVGAVRAAAPSARLIVDANEGWDFTLLERIVGMLAALDVDVIEQPLPAGADDCLRDFPSPVPLCADESCHTAGDIDRLAGAYGMINVKLDKAGGLTEALRMTAAARERGLRVMVGCMVATSLGIAPAMLLAADADIVDLDGPLWLAHDRGPALKFADGYIFPPEPALWG